MNKWDKRFMDLAKHISQWSHDPSTKVGTVIVDDQKRIISVGYNGFPRGIIDRNERYLDKPTKYKLVVHGEANAILNAITSVKGFMLYSTKAPCSDCAKLIIQSGIKTVVSPPALTEGIWAEDAKWASMLFGEAGVDIVQV